ncbi:hypothetical protein CYMTET_33777, partial [Cymbomonas tetramitiformis]
KAGGRRIDDQHTTGVTHGEAESEEKEDDVPDEHMATEGCGESTTGGSQGQSGVEDGEEIVEGNEMERPTSKENVQDNVTSELRKGKIYAAAWQSALPPRRMPNLILK